MKDLLLKSERLANEVARKDVLISSIEYKMFEVSDRVVKADEFNQWIDSVVSEKIGSDNGGGGGELFI